MTTRRIVAVIAGGLLACARPSPNSVGASSTAPSFMIGEFQDDYGDRHVITASEWRQQPRNRFHIVRWVPERRYLIAQNDTSNSADGGRWTRIDWVVMESPPYTWAFCFSAYKALSLAAAESVSIAKPETPRTGCNGYPYSRMRSSKAP